FGSTHIPINTFNKVWIVPDKAVVVEEGGSAFTLDWHLKVMMEEDYLALGENLTSKKFGIKFMSENKAKETNKLSSEFVRDIILPELEKEINEGRHFAPMRQVYLSVILATWFKRNLKESLLGKIYMNQGKVAGVDTEDKEIKDKIYQQYLQAFKLGVYYFIKEEADFATQTMIPRRYFSGGIVKIGESTDRALLVKPPSEMTQDELNRVTSGVFAAIRTQLAEPAERKVIEAGRETKEGALMAGKDDIIELVTEALTGNMMLDDIHVIPNVMDIDSPIQLLDMKRFKSFDKKGLIIIDAITISKPKKVIGYYEAEKLISDRYGDIKYFNDSLMHLSSQTLKFVDGSTLLIMLPTIESFMFPILERYALLTTLETLFVETIQKMQLLRLRLASAKPADSAMMANQQKTIELVIKALKDNEMLYEVPAALFFRVKVFEPTIHPLDTQRFKSFNEKGLTIIDATAGISEPKKVIDYDEAEKLIDIRCSDVKYFDDSLLHFASQALEFEDGSTLLIMLPMIWSFILPTIKKFALLSTSQGVMLQLIVKLIRASAIRESAMMAGNKKTRWTRQHNEQTTGGIDFNPRLLDLQIKRDGRGVPLPLPMQDVEHINIEGLYPVIINIAPVNIQTMPFLSRLKEQEERFMHSTS
ncbi:MAG: hypothetical protein KAR05_05660, partial [Candidatus Omnitrophica bacterium]|nr:hypothetical protein [Candidatus Omnitrophota bacterium]